MGKKRKPVSADRMLESQFDHFAKDTIKHVIRKVLQDYLYHQDQVHIVSINDYEDLAAPEGTPDYEKTKVALGSSSVLFENEILASGIEKLTKRHREVLECAFVLDMPDQAIAELMNLKNQTIRNYKHEAYDILRKYMREGSDE